MEIPDKVNVDFLVENQDNPEWADFLFDNWEKVLGDLENDSFPAAAYNMAVCMYNRAGRGLDEAGRIHYHTKVVRIANAGLEWMEQTRMNGQPASRHPQYGLHCGNLCWIRGKTLTRLNRPFEAIRMLESAALHYSAFEDTIPENDQTDDIIRDLELKITGCGVDIAEALYRYSVRLPDVARRTQLSFVVSYLRTAYDSYETLGDRDAMKHVEKIFQIPAGMLDELGGVDVARMSEIDGCRFGDDYIGWVAQNRLYMNIAAQMPKCLDEWLNDDLNFLPDDLSAMVLSDAFYAYDHCRDTMYEFYNLDESMRYGEGRSIDVEILVDVYLRLLTILNKIGKVLDTMYTARGKVTDFRKVAKSLMFNPNKYVRAVACII